MFNTINKVNDQDKSKTHGSLSCLSCNDILTLLSCLDFSYYLSLAFDSSSELKFAIKKVTKLEQDVTLHRQGVSAATIKLTFLLEHCIALIEKHGVKGDDLIKLINNNSKNDDDDTFSDHFIFYCKKLQKSISVLCKTCVEFALKKKSANTCMLNKEFLFKTYASGCVMDESNKLDRDNDRKRFPEENHVVSGSFPSNDFIEDENCIEINKNEKETQTELKTNGDNYCVIK